MSLLEDHWLTNGPLASRDYACRAVSESVGPWSPRAAGIVTAILVGDRIGASKTRSNAGCRGIRHLPRSRSRRQHRHPRWAHGDSVSRRGLFGRIAMLTAAVGLVAYGFLDLAEAHRSTAPC